MKHDWKLKSKSYLDHISMHWCCMPSKFVKRKDISITKSVWGNQTFIKYHKAIWEVKIFRSRDPSKNQVFLTDFQLGTWIFRSKERTLVLTTNYVIISQSQNRAQRLDQLAFMQLIAGGPEGCRLELGVVSEVRLRKAACGSKALSSAFKGKQTLQ